MIARLRPYGLHLYLLAYAPAMLLADGAMRDLGPQLALGVVTFVVYRNIAPPADRSDWRQSVATIKIFRKSNGSAQLAPNVDG